MKAFVVALCVAIAGSALAQADAKVKAIRAGNQAAEDANAVAVGVHKRDAGADAGPGAEIAKEAKPKATPEPK